MAANKDTIHKFQEFHGYSKLNYRSVICKDWKKCVCVSHDYKMRNKLFRVAFNDSDSDSES
jgi:hypothetical protein